MRALSHSASPLLRGLLQGPLIWGVPLSGRELQFGNYVVSLTSPGALRMPNGIECAAEAHPNDRITIGRGRLVIGHIAINPGPEWNPIPSVERRRVLPPGPAPFLSALAVSGPGLMPTADDVLAGYVAGLVLLHKQHKRAARIAEGAASRTNSLSATLLGHASLGEVPEPVHRLLATGDAKPLLSFGHSSGQAWLRGLVSAGYAVDIDGPQVPAVRLAARAT